MAVKTQIVSKTFLPNGISFGWQILRYIVCHLAKIVLFYVYAFKFVCPNISLKFFFLLIHEGNHIFQMVNADCKLVDLSPRHIHRRGSPPRHTSILIVQRWAKPVVLIYIRTFC